MSDGTDRVMVDIETLGLEPGCAILSIGAVRFDEDGLGEEDHWNVSLESCQEAGLTIDAGTLDWWLEQDEDVQHVLTGGRRLPKVLFHFARFYGDADEIWAYSPQFDCAILEAAYDAVGEAKPWTYDEERDARTLASISVAADADRDGDENKHDALDDARYQARMVSETLSWTEEWS